MSSYLFLMYFNVICMPLSCLVSQLCCANKLALPTMNKWTETQLKMYAGVALYPLSFGVIMDSSMYAPKCSTILTTMLPSVLCAAPNVEVISNFSPSVIFNGHGLHIPIVEHHIIFVNKFSYWSLVM